MQDYTEEGRSTPHWLKRMGRPHRLDELIPTQKLLEEQVEKLSPAQADEIEGMMQCVSPEKSVLSRELNPLDSQVQEAHA